MKHFDDLLLGSAHPDPNAYPILEWSGDVEPPLTGDDGAAGRRVHTSATLRADRRPYPHRFRLVDGRALEGSFYREPSSRLVDDLYGIKGDFICVLDARYVDGGDVVPFLVLNVRHIIAIEEL